MNDEEAEKLPVKGTSIVCVWYLSTSLRISSPYGEWAMTKELRTAL